ncbi:MAG: hypothetical protein ACI9A7_002523, partial [Cyclobacteriaceae bacterium]
HIAFFLKLITHLQNTEPNTSQSKKLKLER